MFEASGVPLILLDITCLLLGMYICNFPHLLIIVLFICLYLELQLIEIQLQIKNKYINKNSCTTILVKALFFLISRS